MRKAPLFRPTVRTAFVVVVVVRQLAKVRQKGFRPRVVWQLGERPKHVLPSHRQARADGVGVDANPLELLE